MHVTCACCTFMVDMTSSALQTWLSLALGVELEMQSNPLSCSLLASEKHLRSSVEFFWEVCVFVSVCLHHVDLCVFKQARIKTLHRVKMTELYFTFHRKRRYNYYCVVLRPERPSVCRAQDQCTAKQLLLFLCSLK